MRTYLVLAALLSFAATAGAQDAGTSARHTGETHPAVKSASAGPRMHAWRRPYGAQSHRWEVRAVYCEHPSNFVANTLLGSCPLCAALASLADAREFCRF
jgi:hypothetical protein